jgi:hypothetical protein
MTTRTTLTHYATPITIPLTTIITTSSCLVVANMDRLPDELLLHMLQFIQQLGPPHHLSQTLANVCLVSRKFHRVATPVLYETLMQVAPNTPCVTKRSVFYRCLKTLHTRAEFRLHIKSLSNVPHEIISDEIAPGAGTKQDKSVSLLPCDNTDPEALIMAVAKNLGISETKAIFARHNAGEDVCFILCALLAPNLEQIKTLIRGRATEGTPPTLLLEYLGRSAIGMPVGQVHNFDKLRYLHFEPSFTLAFPVTHAFPLVLLPRLNHLALGAWGAVTRNLGYVIDPNDSVVFGRSWTWPLRTSRISELSLWNLFTTPQIVCRMIQACQSLTRFVCIAIDPISVAGRHDLWWYNHIALALQDHRNTLREIEIGEDFSPISFPHTSGRLHSLQNMASLARLRVPWQILLGHDDSVTFAAALPRSIEELTIELFDIPHGIDLEAALAKLHEDCNSGSLPVLKRVHLLWRLMSTPIDFAFDVARLRSLYATGHVCFDLTIHCGSMTSKSANFKSTMRTHVNGRLRAKAPSLTALRAIVPRIHTICRTQTTRAIRSTTPLCAGFDVF